MTTGSHRFGRRVLLAGAVGAGAVVVGHTLSEPARSGSEDPDSADNAGTPENSSNTDPSAGPSGNGSAGSDGEPRLALAHYFGPYPRSLDNAENRAEDYYTAELLNPAGEGGKHAAYGGFLRDRPIFRARDASPSWTGDDCRFDVQAAQQAGLDGFFVDILSASGANWERYRTLRDEADRLDTGFRVVPMLDTTGAAAAAGPQAAADAIAEFFTGRAVWRLADGRSVFASFKTEGKSPSWWQEVIDRLKQDHDAPTAFVSVALDGSAHADYQALSYAESVWSYGADPESISNAADQAQAARKRGKRFMAPVNGQDCRPYAGSFDEAANTEATRAAWDKLIAQQADLVQVVTWSDFSEGSAVAPSEARGYAPLRLTSRYLRQWKTGGSLVDGKDELILSHRSSFAAARPSGDQTSVMEQAASRHRTDARDTVEALTFLTASAQVTLRIGSRTVSYQAPAGLHAHLEPLATGAVSGQVVRSGATVASVSSPVPVVADPIRDDKQYFWFSSAGTTGQRAPWPV